MANRIRVSLAASVVVAASIAGVGVTATAAAQASCNPNTGCLPRPTDVMEVGRQFYAVKPRTLDIVQNRSNHIYVTDLRWSRWTGGYGIHGLIPGSAQGTGFVHVTDRHSVRKATIYLSRVANYGVNAFTYYDKMRIRGDPGVAQYWTWVNRSNRWVT